MFSDKHLAHPDPHTGYWNQRDRGTKVHAGQSRKQCWYDEEQEEREEVHLVLLVTPRVAR